VRLAEQLSLSDLIELRDLLHDRKLRAGVSAAVVVEGGPSVVVDSAPTALMGMWIWTCAFDVVGHSVAVVFANEHRVALGQVEEELIDAARAVRRRLTRMPSCHEKGVACRVTL